MENEIGAVPAGVKTRTLTMDGAEWADTPYFIAGIPDDAPNARPLNVDKSLSGKLVAIRKTQDGKHSYACLEDRAGNKFRLRVGSVLLGHLSTLSMGTEIIVTYKGEKVAAKSGNNFKDFEVQVIDGSLN